MCLVHLISSLGFIQTEEIAKAVTQARHRHKQTQVLISLVIPASDPLVTGPSWCWPIRPGLHLELDQLCACSSKPNSEKNTSLQGQVENLVNYECLVGFSLTFFSVSGHLYLFLPKADLLQCKMFGFCQSSLKPSAVAFFLSFSQISCRYLLALCFMLYLGRMWNRIQLHKQ